MSEPAGVAAPGYRLPAGLRLGDVRLQVADLARSLAYYTTVLGLRELPQSGGDDAVLGSADGTVLLRLHERRGARPMTTHGRLGLYHFAILLPARADLGRFLRHLAERHVRAGASDHLVSEALYLRDPDGLGIEIYTDRPRDSWRLRGSELQMSSLPLDADSVMREAGDTQWTGMPAGTVMGHVHLHVGDIAAADAFFHGVVGFDRMVWSYPGALFLAAGGYHHHLGLNTWAGPDAVPPADADARLLAWTIVLPTAADVEAAAASVERAGHPSARDDGVRLISDPWGSSFRLVADE